MLSILTGHQVEKIVTDEAGAREEAVANPPKVCYQILDVSM